MKALAAIRLQECSFAYLVEPRLIGGAGFHDGENVNKTGVVTALSQDLLDSSFLPGSRLSHELDFYARSLGNTLCILTDLKAKRFGPSSIVEDADIVTIEIGSHAASVAKYRECPLDNDTVITREDTSDLISISFHKRCHLH